MAGKDTASLDSGAGAKAANNAVDDLSEVIRALDKKAQGEFSLRLLIAARSQGELYSIAPAVHRVFVEARAQVMEETLGNLSAFYAMFPGNGKFNVFPMWLGEDHHARLSSIYAPDLGHAHSEDLDAEYLNVFETRTRTPFFQDVYVDGVRVMLILGPTGSGKSVSGNLSVAHEQKYGGFTYIFDIGGSYESVVELYGGRVDRIGKDGPRVNPFSLEPTESNIQFLYSFVKLLLMSGGAELEPEDDDVIHKAVKDTGLRVLSAVSAAVPVRLMKRDLLFVIEKLVSLMEEPRLDMLARQHGIRQKRDDGGIGKTLAAYIRRADEGTLSRLLVETSILLAVSRSNPATILRDAASIYKVDTDAITLKVKQEFAAKEKAKKTPPSTAKVAKKAA